MFLNLELLVFKIFLLNTLRFIFSISGEDLLVVYPFFFEYVILFLDDLFSLSLKLSLFSEAFLSNFKNFSSLNTNAKSSFESRNIDILRAFILRSLN